MPEEDNAVYTSEEVINNLLGVRKNYAGAIPEASHRVPASHTEMYLRNIFVPESKDAEKNVNLTNLQGALTDVSSEISQKKVESRNISAIAPEVDQAATIIKTSVFSPNDQSDDSIKLEINENIPDDLAKEILKYSNDFFNDGLKFGKIRSECLEKAMFRDGSAPIAIIPPSTINKLVMQNTAQITNEGLNETTWSSTVFDQMAESELFSHRGSSKVTNESYNQFIKGLYNNRRVDRQALIDETGIVGSEDYLNSIANAMSKAEDEMFKLANDTDVLRVTDNIGILKMTEVRRNVTLESLKKSKSPLSKLKINSNDDASSAPKKVGADTRKRGGRKVNENHITNIDERVKYGTKKFLDITDALNTASVGSDIDAHPFLLRLSAESVIPISIPGSPDSHVGYFVLVDKHGVPISNYKEVGAAANRYMLSQQAFNAFSGVNTNSDVQNIEDDIQVTQDKTNAINGLCEKVTESFIKTQLEASNISGISVGVSQDLAKCMFYRLLCNMQTGLVFIPRESMIYYAYDYNDNGTGRSKLENISFVLSLRVTLLVASIMGSIRNAIDTTIVDLNFDEKTHNPLQVADLVKQIYVDENRHKYGYDPKAITQSIALSNFKMKPTGLPGLNYDIKTDKAQSNSNSRIDSDLVNILSSMMVTNLSVPHAALNQLSEKEYSRSVATTNTLFSKYIADVQEIQDHFDTEFVRTFMRNSTTMYKKILSMVDSRSGDDTIEIGGIKYSGQDEESKILIYEKIVDSIRTRLSPPIMAVEKLHFEEMETIIRGVKSLVEAYISTDMVPRDNQDDVRMLQAHALAKIIKEVFPRLGAASIVTNMEGLADIDGEDVENFVLNVTNIAQGVKNLAVFKPSEEGGSSSGGGSRSPW
jgi:hypothetical protein